MRVGVDFGTTHTIAAVVDGETIPSRRLRRRPVRRRDDGPDVEERYVVTPGGAVEVTLTTRPVRLSRTFRLERHNLTTA